ncbi:hypothetical protein [Thalassococcus arenae]|nr:hypothetical protein [Thalassococcus arenae]
MVTLLQRIAALYAPPPRCGPLCRDVADEIEVMHRAAILRAAAGK